jgi:hypothetical protein
MRPTRGGLLGITQSVHQAVTLREDGRASLLFVDRTVYAVLRRSSETLSPAHAGLFLPPLDFLGRDQASLFAPSEPRQSADEQARNHNHHSGDEYGQAGKQQEVAQEIEHIAQQQLNTIPLR